MEHGEALEIEAADRYVLGLLSAAEAHAFEEHYFDCRMCADEVRLGMRILDGGRRLASEKAPASPLAPIVPIEEASRRGARFWLVAAAAVLLLAIPVNVFLLMRMQNAPASVATRIVAAELYLPSGQTRGAGETPVLSLDEGASGQLAVDVPPGFTQHEVQLLRGEERIATYAVPPKLTEDTLKITVTDPGPGSYALVIVGSGPSGQRAEIVRSPFRIARPLATR
jgi:anti-sigma factor RsiW